MDERERLKLIRSSIAEFAFTLGKFIALGLIVQEETRRLINTMDEIEKKLD